MLTRNPFRLSTLAVALGTTGVALSASPAAHAQQVPTPFELVSQMDYECRPVNEAPPPVPQLLIRQLNPVLKDQIPPQVVQLGPLQQLCVPVAKNGNIPTPSALPIVANSDLACYQATGPWPVNVDLKVNHLNPVIKNLPAEFVHLTDLQSVCLPVRKNDAQILPAIRQIDSYVDQACYNLQEPTSLANRTLDLSHLNPVIRAMQFQDRKVVMQRARVMCVPIAKNNEVVPAAVLDLVQWADFLKYRVDLVQGAVPVFPLWLSHLNPLFTALPKFPVTVYNDPIHLMVPVMKNDRVPPGGVVAH